MRLKELWRGHRRLCVLALVLLLLALLALGCYIAVSSVGGTLSSQRVAEDFRGSSETRFAQISAFFPVDGGKDEAALYTFRRTLDSALVEASLEAPENGSLYSDAWSAVGSVTVVGEKGSASVTAVGIGGDFFRFHPLYLRSGSYISGDDLMHDRVVLDEELAWKLFGGVELEGMEVTISGSTYLVAGVVSRDHDRASEKAAPEGETIYMAWDKLNAAVGTSVSCYELVCADPIDGFAQDIVQKGFPDATVVENSGRFNAARLWDIVQGFGSRSMSTAAVVYPPWENAARFLEDWCALLLLLSCILAVLPVLGAVTAVVLALRAGAKWLKRMKPVWIERTQDKLYDRRQERKQNKKPV